MSRRIDSATLPFWRSLQTRRTLTTLAVLPATLLFLWLMPRLKVAVPEA